MYDSSRHETLIQRDWNDNRAREAIERIVQDTHSRFDHENLWPVHPLDQPHAERPFRMLYFGAAGVVWALDYLHRVGATAIKHDFAAALSGMAANNRNDLNLSESQARSYLMGDVGIDLVQWRIDPSIDIAERIYRAVELNLDNPAREFMWGSPGTMLTALFMHELTGEDLWKELYIRNA